MRRLAVLVVLALAACVLPPSDQPAHYSRMGRFIGLVANCGCSNLTAERVLADYAKVAAGRYSAAEIAAMKGYVDVGAREIWPNLPEVCAEVCSQRCMVQAVVEPLGGRGMGVSACLVSERDLHLTDGSKLDLPGGGRD